MPVSNKLAEGLNQQIANELNAHIKYLTIASYFEEQTLPALAEFYYEQATEEHEHAMKFVKFLVDTSTPVRIPAIPAPPHDIKSAEQAVELSLKSEQAVTAQIMELVQQAEADRNRFALLFLDWFVEEQQEEENLMDSLLSLVRRSGEQNLLMVEALVARGALRDEEDEE